ncbi:hypothetical protein H4Q32_024505 [Labeo rohita]|uniref:Uncharacterized protein n=1 Tax=Labeo rohita TaxID=84645 RepID=A0ABQ8L8D2_LABRO|nr:hypothetical protein H4Q32_024505 [Labeo rohita]
MKNTTPRVADPEEEISLMSKRKSSDNGRIPNGMGSCFSGQIVRTDNTTVVTYINRQGGKLSLQLHNLVRKLIVWSTAHFSSLHATHVPGVLNVGADVLSRGLLHPDENAPLGVDALGHLWLKVLLYAFPQPSLVSPTLDRVRENGLSLLLIAPRWPREAVAGRDCPAPLGRALATPIASEPAVASRWANFSPPSGMNQSLGLAREGLNINALGLPKEVIYTIQSARAPSTRSLCDLKWWVFEDWCTRKGVIPFQ